MSLLLSDSSSIPISDISREDLYNHLYWDHRIYDVRSAKDYNESHVCRSHNMNPRPIVSVDSIANIDAQIDDDYGRAENPSKVVIYTNNRTHHDYQSELDKLNSLISYLISSLNPMKKSLTQIDILIDGYQNFHLMFPFLCSDSISYSECSQLAWPSYITSNLYLGSAMCRNETVISMLNITHIISFSDYPEKKLNLSDIKTLHWQISDSLSTKLLPVLSPTIEWISKGIDDNKGIVLIHCDQGVSRSASVVIAYLLQCNAAFGTVDAALNYVKSKRGVIRPNPSFLDQLEEYLISIRTNNENINTKKR